MNRSTRAAWATGSWWVRWESCSLGLVASLLGLTRSRPPSLHPLRGARVGFDSQHVNETGNQFDGLP
ncbi:MAG: hypothetical protein Q8O51_00825 [bacterium]|nr:hypothetical protein [bacterium]